MNKKIVVLGGGTAGWLTALLVKRFYNNADVTVVESSDIGILGAGEGTVPHIIGVLDFLGIPVSDLIKHCSATLKLGVRFTNWHGDGTSYLHSFTPNRNLSFDAMNEGFKTGVVPMSYVSRGDSLDKVTFYHELINQSKVPFSYADNLWAQSDDPISRLNHHGTFALHFNARLLAEYLKDYALGVGVKRIDGKVSELFGDTKLNAMQLDSGELVEGDFFFDCSGFRRLLIGEYMGSEWVSYNKHMPLDTALPFFIPHDGKNIAPETEAIAMKYGWVWKIPVQDRYGCGYVFDSKFLNEEQAMAEVKEMFGDVESPKTFKFKAGTYKEVIKGNVMAVGLAQGFVEPLEATAIWIACTNLISFLKDDGINNDHPMYRQLFNEECYQRNHEVVEFLYAHYLTERNDTEFWRNFKTNTEMVDSLKPKLDLWQVTPLSGKHINERLFNQYSWLQVADGCRLLNRQPVASMCDNLKFSTPLGFFMNQRNASKGCITHEEFINLLME